MKLFDYECQTTFWQDFSIAEKFGKEAIIDTYERSKKYWGKDRIYGTELSMVLNHKCWFHHETQNLEVSEIYSKLWTKYHDWVLDNWKGEDLTYYLKTTD